MVTLNQLIIRFSVLYVLAIGVFVYSCAQELEALGSHWSSIDVLELHAVGVFYLVAALISVFLVWKVSLNVLSGRAPNFGIKGDAGYAEMEKGYQNGCGALLIVFCASAALLVSTVDSRLDLFIGYDVLKVVLWITFLYSIGAAFIHLATKRKYVDLFSYAGIEHPRGEALEYRHDKSRITVGYRDENDHFAVLAVYNFDSMQPRLSVVKE